MYKHDDLPFQGHFNNKLIFPGLNSIIWEHWNLYRQWLWYQLFGRVHHQSTPLKVMWNFPRLLDVCPKITSEYYVRMVGYNKPLSITGLTKSLYYTLLHCYAWLCVSYLISVLKLPQECGRKLGLLFADWSCLAPHIQSSVNYALPMAPRCPGRLGGIEAHIKPHHLQVEAGL